MTAQRPAVQSRKPTGVVPYPLVLLEGEEKSGRSWAAILLSASPRVGETFVLDLGEGGADEYKNIPGCEDRFEILSHDGTWAQIVDRVMEVKALAVWAKANGQPPVVLVIDTMTDLWNGLKSWVDARYRKSRAGQAAMAKDPDGELKPSQNLWNDANARHRRLMTQLMTFPGIVVMIARGKEVTEVKGGKPVEGGAKVWAIEAQKDVPFDASVWVRMFRTSPPLVIGARSVHVGVKPGKDDPQPITSDPENLLEWLIFDVLKCDPETATVRDLKHTTGGELSEDERADDPDEQQDRVQRVRNIRAAAVSPEDAERRALITEVGSLASAAGVREDVIRDWAQDHDGQDIRHATDIGALEMLRDDLVAKAAERQNGKVPA